MSTVPAMPFLLEPVRGNRDGTAGVWQACPGSSSAWCVVIAGRSPADLAHFALGSDHLNSARSKSNRRTQKDRAMTRIGSRWIVLLVALLVLTGLPSIPTTGARQDMP